MQGHLTAITDNQARVNFTATFPKERTEKDDYRAIVEKTLAQVTGHQIRLVCSQAIDGPPLKTAVAQPPAAVSQATADPGMEYPAVKQAQMMFGGKVIKIEEEK
jgi:DNA polymerase-3 subunit gamma/tau